MVRRDSRRLYSVPSDYALISYHKTEKIAILPVAFLFRDMYSIIDRKKVPQKFCIFTDMTKEIFAVFTIVHTFVIAACYTFRERKTVL